MYGVLVLSFIILFFIVLPSVGDGNGFLAGSKSIIQTLLSPREGLERDTMQKLYMLSEEKPVVVQWILSHCGLVGHEEADRLAFFIQ